MKKLMPPITLFALVPLFTLASPAPSKIDPLGIKMSTSATTMPNIAKSDSSCAKVSLSAIYGGQKSYWSEYERYGATLEEIGYSPEEGPCKNNWEATIRLFNGAKEFLAESIHKKTGETWTINEKKTLTQTHAPK